MNLGSISPNFHRQASGCLRTTNALHFSERCLLNSMVASIHCFCVISYETQCYDLPLFLFFRLIISFSCNYSSLPCHQPADSLVFVITSFHLLLWTSLCHSHLHICTSSQFYCIPSVSICFVIVPDFSMSQVYKPLIHFMSP